MEKFKNSKWRTIINNWKEEEEEEEEEEEKEEEEEEENLSSKYSWNFPWKRVKLMR